MKVWCSRCYGIIRYSMKNKYGDYEFTNADLLTYIHGNEIEEVLLPPIPKFKVPVKTKKGVSKSKTEIIMPFSINYCPFCGKEIQTCGDDYEENGK